MNLAFVHSDPTLALGVCSFAFMGLAILYEWWKANGDALRKVVADA